MRKLVFVLFVFCCAIGMLATGSSVWAAADDAIRAKVPGAIAVLEGYGIPGMIVNASGQGDLLLAPIYKTSLVGLQGGAESFVTYFTIANTNSSKYNRVHVRLRSARFSVEVWDREFDLSPNDVIWFQVETLASGAPQIRFETPGGTNTTELLKSTLLEQIGFVNALAPTTEPARTTYFNGEMSIGEIEVFGIGSSTSMSNDIDTAQLDCGNDLIGMVMMGDFTTGVYSAYPMTAISNFRTDYTNSTSPTAIAHRDGGEGFIDEDNVAYFHPDWATTTGPTLNDGDDFLVTRSVDRHAPQGSALSLTDNWSIDDVEMALTKTRVNAAYFNGGFPGASTYSGMWVTFPTKYLHYFFNQIPFSATAAAAFPVGDEVLATDRRLHLGVALASTNPVVTAAANLALYPVPLGVVFKNHVYNLVEDVYNPSSPNYSPPLPYQVNFVPIGDKSQDFFVNEKMVYLGASAANRTPFNAPKAGTPAFYAGYFDIYDFRMADANTWGTDLITDVKYTPLLGLIAQDLFYSTGFRSIGYASYYLPPLALMVDNELAGGIVRTRAYMPQWDIFCVAPAGTLCNPTNP